MGGPAQDRADTGEGEGKRRLWRAATDFHSYYPSDFEGDEDSETALNWLARDYVRHFSEQAERWVDASPTWPAPWQDACGSSDDMVLVTAEQLSAMREECAALHVDVVVVLVDGLAWAAAQHERTQADWSELPEGFSAQPMSSRPRPETATSSSSWAPA